MPTLHARDWSRELEESEYCLPFTVGAEEHERGARAGRVVSFRDEVCLPMLDAGISQGLGIEWGDLGLDRAGEENRDQVDEEVGSVFEFGMVLGIEAGSLESLEQEEDESLVSEVSAIDSLDSDISAAESEWTVFSEEAEGIEMFF